MPEYERKLKYTIDLDAPVNVVGADGILMQGNREADTLEIRLKRDGQEVQLSGVSAIAMVTNSSGNTIRNQGTVAENTFIIPFEAESYSVPGKVQIEVIIEKTNGIKRTILVLSGYVESNRYGVVIDPTDAIPSYEDIASIMRELSEALENIGSSSELANEAAQTATDAANSANAAAQNATSAAAGATQAAQGAASWENATATAAGLTPASAPTVSVSTQDGAKLLHFGIPRGEQGEQGAPYTIKGAAYATLAALTAGVQSPQMGDQYNVGEEAPYNVYRWTGSGWEDQGQLGVSMENSTPTKAGLMSAEDKSKLDGIEAGANRTPNRNLLDNWDFRNPVNQRGVSTFTAGEYGLDRWLLGWGTCGWSNGILTLNGGLYQFIDTNAATWPLNGMPCTVSVMLADGSIHSAVITPSATSDVDAGIPGIGGIGLYNTQREDKQYKQFGIGVSTNVQIAAIKLERGTVSTLAQDAPMDYADMLLKCQRYFYAVYYNQYQTIGLSFEEPEYAFLIIPLPTAMRVRNGSVYQSAPVMVGYHDRYFTRSELSGCHAILGVNYPAIPNPVYSGYVYTAHEQGVTIQFICDL